MIPYHQFVCESNFGLNQDSKRPLPLPLPLQPLCSILTLTCGALLLTFLSLPAIITGITHTSHPITPLPKTVAAASPLTLLPIPSRSAAILAITDRKITEMSTIAILAAKLTVAAVVGAFVLEALAFAVVGC